VFILNSFYDSHHNPQARLALCEAMTVLFLHQNKVPPQVQSAISNLEVRTSLAINNISPNAKSDACEHTMVDSNSRQFLPTPTMTKPKTLLELADGDIDLLDETNLSTSAVENSQIEIDSFADADPTIPVLQTSFALKDSPEIQVLRSHSIKLVSVGVKLFFFAGHQACANTLWHTFSNRRYADTCAISSKLIQQSCCYASYHVVI
jgi:hypothetical protein